MSSGKGPGGIGRQLAEYKPAVCSGGQEGRHHPGLCQKQCGQQGSDCSPVPSSGEATL